MKLFHFIVMLSFLCSGSIFAEDSSSTESEIYQVAADQQPRKKSSTKPQAKTKKGKKSHEKKGKSSLLQEIFGEDGDDDGDGDSDSDGEE